MSLDPAQLLNWRIKDVVQHYDERDAMFYALSLGIGEQAADRAHLRYVYESGLEILPSFACVLADPGPWLADPRLGLDWANMLHAEQRLTLHRPLTGAALVRSRSRVVWVEDRGQQRGARVMTRRGLSEANTGAPLATLEMTSILRGDGGFTTGPFPGSCATVSTPTRASVTVEHRVPSQAALLFRLNGDMNPLHADPGAAISAGYPQPILHGMATFGIASFAVLQAAGLPLPRCARSRRVLQHRSIRARHCVSSWTSAPNPPTCSRWGAVSKCCRKDVRRSTEVAPTFNIDRHKRAEYRH
jgi:MaoC like domain